MSAQGCRWIQSSGSGPDGLDRSQISRKQKQTKKLYRSCNFLYTLHTILLGEKGVTIHEKTNLLIEHLQFGSKLDWVRESLTLSIPSLFSAISTQC